MPLGAKPLALLVYLRLATNRRAHRAFLADLLWSEVDEDRGRASLRQAVLAIRQALGDDLIVTDGQDLRLAGEIECDAARFVGLANEGNFVSAVGQYSGDFYERFALPGAQGFETWATMERSRLRGVFVRVADFATQRLLDEGRTKPAGEIAKQLVAMDETRQRSWRLLIECRLAQGDVAAAGVDAESMRAILDANSNALEPATELVLQRIQRGRAATAATPSPLIRAELVGRSHAFASLLGAWDLVGTQGRIVRSLAGDSGFGKTRLLDEVSSRLRSRGARVVSVGARLGDRGVPYALVAQLADALVALPGAAGVSPESASTLVALEPHLRSTFQVATKDLAMSVDIPLRRTTAMADLIGAVCEDRAVALLIDDMHWADEASLPVLAAALSRVSHTRLLVVLASRHTIGVEFGVEEIALNALGVNEILELVESIASLPNAAWAAALPEAFLSATRGVPLLVMEALELLTQGSLLVHSGDGWTTSRPEELAARLTSLDVRRERLLQLDESMRRILLTATLAAGPIDETVLAASVPDVDAAQCTDRLAAGGWIVRGSSGLVVRHDDIAQSVLDAAVQADVMDASHAVLRALIGKGSKTDIEWRMQARLAVSLAEFQVLSDTVAAWIAVDTSSRRNIGVREAGTTLLGHLATVAVVRELQRRRSFAQRFLVVPRAAVAASVLIATIGVLAIHAHRTAVTPYALRFVSAPLASSDVAMTPAPTVEIVNRDGARIDAADNLISLRVAKGPATLVGGLPVRASGGIAEFPAARVLNNEGDGVVTIDAVSPGLSPAHASLLTFRDVALRVVRARVVGAESQSQSRNGTTVTARAGERFSIEADILYTSSHSAASVMLAGVPDWGAASKSWIELGALVTPARDGHRFVRIELTAPDSVGEFRLFLAMGAESDAAHIASATNWAAGPPRWDDGNDIATWDESVTMQARRSGFVILPPGKWLYRSGYSMGMTHIGVGVIDVKVIPAAATHRIAAARKAVGP